MRPQHNVLLDAISERFAVEEARDFVEDDCIVHRSETREHGSIAGKTHKTTEGVRTN